MDDLCHRTTNCCYGRCQYRFSPQPTLLPDYILMQRIGDCLNNPSLFYQPSPYCFHYVIVGPIMQKLLGKCLIFAKYVMLWASHSFRLKKSYLCENSRSLNRTQWFQIESIQVGTIKIYKNSNKLKAPDKVFCSLSHDRNIQTHIVGSGLEGSHKNNLTGHDFANS